MPGHDHVWFQSDSPRTSHRLSRTHPQENPSQHPLGPTEGEGAGRNQGRHVFPEFGQALRAEVIVQGGLIRIALDETQLAGGIWA